VAAAGRNHFLHRLILLAFVGPCPPGKECCHYDGDPANNRLENLRWDTRKSNAADRTRHGTMHMPVKRGSSNGLAKLDEAQVVRMRQLRAEGARVDALAALFGVSRNTASAILNRRTWSHVP
jgi:hypothetical protein